MSRISDGWEMVPAYRIPQNVNACGRVGRSPVGDSATPAITGEQPPGAAKDATADGCPEPVGRDGHPIGISKEGREAM